MPAPGPIPVNTSEEALELAAMYLRIAAEMQCQETQHVAVQCKMLASQTLALTPYVAKYA